MGIHVKKCANGKYRLWSTISDVFLTKEISRKETLSYLHQQELFRLKLDFIKDWYTFPGHRVNYQRGGYHPFEKEKLEEYNNWLKNLNGENDKDEVERRYQEILKDINSP